jgi:hypothetical protein
MAQLALLRDQLALADDMHTNRGRVREIRGHAWWLRAGNTHRVRADAVLRPMLDAGYAERGPDGEYRLTSAGVGARASAHAALLADSVYARRGVV